MDGPFSPGVVEAVAFQTISNVYVENLSTGALSLVSVDTAGTGPGNDSSQDPVFSANGEFVVFDSFASNLVSTTAGQPAVNNAGSENVFIRNLQTGVTQLVGVGPKGTDIGGDALSGMHIKALPAVSADGTFVLFDCLAVNLVANVSNETGATAAYLRDMQTGVTQLVSVTSSGAPAVISEVIGGVTGNPPYRLQLFSPSLLSPSGQFALFVSDTPNVVAGMAQNDDGTDVYLRNLATQTTELVSVNAAGTGTGDDSSSLFLPAALSADGRYVVFWSNATDLVNGITTSGINLFVRDMQQGVTSLIDGRVGLQGHRRLYRHLPDLRPAVHRLDRPGDPDRRQRPRDFRRPGRRRDWNPLSVSYNGTSGGLNVVYSPDILDDPTLFGKAPITAVHFVDLFPENTVGVDPGLTPPVTMGSAAPNATATTVAGEPVTIDVLPDDGDASETVTAVTVPGHGSATINPNSTITYTPATGFSGTDTFTYTALLTNTTQTSTSFTGLSGHTYGFFSVATDAAGKVQPTPGGAQATTTVVSAAGLPISSVSPLPATTTNATFTVSWSGSPGAGASSITSFNVFFSVNGSAFIPLISHTTATSLSFTGVAGDTYGFYSVATNNLGLVQPTSAFAQAKTTVLGSPPPPPPPPVPPVIIGEYAVFKRKTNKKGKPTGKSVLTDFIFNFSASLDQTTAAIVANYQLDSISTRKVKKKTTTILHPITGFTMSYIKTTDSVDLKLIGTQAFPTGGRLTILSGSAGEVSGASGTPLEGTTVFAISKKGTTINP